MKNRGFNVRLSSIVCIYNKMVDDNPVIGIIYKSQIIDGELKFDKEEIADAKWFTYDEILKMEDNLRRKDVLIKCLENIKNDNYILLDNLINFK